jgi:hypothetical protein
MDLIETNIDAGITLYTDHKPALFENSLSNKGQLSAWKLTEVADLLMAIVEHIYCQRSGMLLADPLSRVCVPTEGWFDPTLPAKLAALLAHLTIEVKNNERIRIYCHQDTIAAARIVQRWRTPKNNIATGRLAQETKAGAFLIGTPTANSLVQEVLHLLKNDRQFAVLMPLSLVSELSRLENSGGAQTHDLDVARKVDTLSKIVFPSSAQVWLVNLAQFAITKILIIMEEGAGLDEVERTFRESLLNLQDMMEQKDDWYDHNTTVELLATTRSKKRTVDNGNEQAESVLTPTHRTITRSRSTAERQMVVPTLERGRISWKRAPREPLPSLAPVDLWVGSQLDHDKMPAKYMHEPPEGELIKNISGRPAELPGIPNHLGAQPRIIVPKTFCEALTMHTHEDIHHQNHQKVTHILKPLYYWPSMDRERCRTLHIRM